MSAWHSLVSQQLTQSQGYSFSLPSTDSVITKGHHFSSSSIHTAHNHLQHTFRLFKLISECHFFYPAVTGKHNLSAAYVVWMKKKKSGLWSHVWVYSLDLEWAECIPDLIVIFELWARWAAELWHKNSAKCESACVRTDPGHFNKYRQNNRAGKGF